MSLPEAKIGDFVVLKKRTKDSVVLGERATKDVWLIIDIVDEFFCRSLVLVSPWAPTTGIRHEKWVREKETSPAPEKVVLILRALYGY